ncbi:MAG: hypothetical protein E2590_12680 [Chryseobacterium sp.]|nr:hypothetical protein [Chryseobacterium sp.]
MPIIFPDHITHSTIAVAEEGTQVYSAGFLTVTAMGLARVEKRGSESLKIFPSPIDAMILNRALMNSGTAAFLDFNF